MTLIALGSIHGSPGVTTAAVALGACWPTPEPAADRPQRQRQVVVEANPLGGVLAARYGLGSEPGLAGLAAAARDGLRARQLHRHAQRIPGGLPVVVGPASPSHASQLIGAVGARLAGRLVDVDDVDVLVDCGPLAPTSPALGVALRADVLLVVARPDIEQLQAAGVRVGELAEDSAGPVEVVLVGSSPYGPAEVADELDVTVAGVLADDPRGAAVVAGQAPQRRFSSPRLLDSAAGLAQQLAQRATAGSSPAGSRFGAGVRHPGRRTPTHG